MDILIKNMEMPEIGKITLDIYPNGDVFEKRGSERIGYAKAIALPEHGRLIDEAKLRERAYAIQRRDRISFTDALAMALIEAETIVEATE